MTSLIGGKRVPKNSIRLESYGTIDELNSYIGLIRSFPIGQPLTGELTEIQSRLFDIGGALATDPEDPKIKMKLGVLPEDVEALEQAIDRMDAEVPPMRSFILPGGGASISFCHIARTICRRAERRILDLAAEAEVDETLLRYINRLSDYLFILARKLTADSGTGEQKWIPRQR